MIRFNNREDIIALTPLWKGERFPDGRPRVADKYLEEMRKMTLEELWKPIFLKGYESQFEGDLKTLHDDGRKLIGRAVTATFVPTRPDLHEVMFGVGAAEGRKGNYNQWVIDSLTEGDVVVVDMPRRQPDDGDQNAHKDGRRRHLGRHPRHRADEGGRGRAGVLPRHRSNADTRICDERLQRHHPHRQGDGASR